MVGPIMRVPTKILPKFQWSTTYRRKVFDLPDHDPVQPALTPSWRIRDLDAAASMSRQNTDADAAMRNETTNGVVWATNGRGLGIIAPAV
jgi:hypothetical protein